MEADVRFGIPAEGSDPRNGLLHGGSRACGSTFDFDLMEPQRPFAVVPVLMFAFTPNEPARLSQRQTVLQNLAPCHFAPIGMESRHSVPCLWYVQAVFVLTNLANHTLGSGCPGSGESLRGFMQVCPPERENPVRRECRMHFRNETASRPLSGRTAVAAWPSSSTDPTLTKG